MLKTKKYKIYKSFTMPKTLNKPKTRPYVDIYESMDAYNRGELLNRVRTTTEQAAARLFWYLWTKCAKIHEPYGSTEGGRCYFVRFLNNEYIYIYHNINIDQIKTK